MRRTRSVSLLLASCALAFGCGSGGGGGDDGESAEITSANAQQLTAEVTAGLFASFLPVTVFDDTGGVTAASALRAPALAPAGGVALAGSAGGISAQASFGPVSETCPQGGSFILSGDVANPSSGPPVVGDQVEADFDQCSFEVGELIDGGFAYTVRQLAAGFLNLALTLDQLEIRDDEGSLIFDGSPTVILDSRATIEKTTVSGGMLQIDDAQGLVLFLLGFTGDRVDGVDSAEITGSGSLASSSFSGELSYTTVNPFAIGVAADFASDGELLIMGANDATIRLLVENEVDLLLELDLDGDGTVDETQETTWEDLFALLD